MKINHIEITSASTLDVEFSPTASICVLYGRYSDLALDLISELVSGSGTGNDPDRVDDGRFVIHADIEMDEKNYSVCYIRNADFMGDNRLAVNFEPNGIAFSEDDTREFAKKCDEDANSPIFICDYFDRLDEAENITCILDQLSAFHSQVFISVCANYPIEKMKHSSVQVVEM